MLDHVRKLAATLAVVIGLGSTAPLHAQTIPVLRIGAIPLKNSAQVFYAKDMGFFAKAGLEVDIQP